MPEPMMLRARIDAPIAEVWRALTDPAALRTWLAEKAEVELPNRYEFWGRYTPEGDAPHQRLLYAEDYALRFAWLLDGEDTTTEIQLAEDGPTSTILSLSQTHFDFQDVLDGAVRGVLETYWSLAIANLSDYLTGRELTGLTDFTSAELRGEITIAAPAAEVYESLIDSEKVTAWFGYPIEIEPFTGGRFAMGGIENNPDPAMIVDLVPGERLAVDWGPVGVATWELAESAGKTRLTYVQSGFDTEHPPYSGWTGIVSGLAELRRYHEIPNWRPIWLSDPADASMDVDATAC